MRFSAVVSGLLLAVGVQGQTSAYTDPSTRITFQGYTAPSGWRLGMVLPNNVESDFIGQIAAPLDSSSRSGWAGISLNGNMVGPLLIAMWPNGTSPGASFRKATSHSNPPVYTGPQTLNPIKAGSYVNSTHMVFTFVCKGCITGSPLSFDKTATGAGIGFALSGNAPTNPRVAAAGLAPHSAVTAQVNMNLASAKSAQYNQWAATAGPALQAQNATRKRKLIRRA